MTSTNTDETMSSFNVKLRHKMSDNLKKQLPIEDGNNLRT